VAGDRADRRSGEVVRVGLYSGSLQTCPPEGYGAEVATWDLACGLSALGHEVVLAAPAGSSTPSRGELLVTQRKNPDSDDWPAAECAEAPGIVQAFRARGARVIHDLSCSGAVHSAACLGRACAHLYTANGISWVGPEVRHNVVVVSAAAREAARAGWGAWHGTSLDGANGIVEPKLDPLAVVRYGCDTDFYSPRAVVPNRALYLGRPHAQKGLDLIPRVARLLPAWEFVCAWRAESNDHRRGEAEFLRDVQGLQNVRVHVLPEGEEHHTAKRDLLASAAVLLHPAVYLDACPRTVIEAQSCGVPVAAFERGGVPEIIYPGRTGALALFPPGMFSDAAMRCAAESLAHAVLEAAKLDRVRVREWALLTLSRERMARSYLALYTALLGAG